MQWMLPPHANAELLAAERVPEQRLAASGFFAMQARKLMNAKERRAVVLGAHAAPSENFMTAPGVHSRIPEALAGSFRVRRALPTRQPFAMTSHAATP